MGKVKSFVDSLYCSIFSRKIFQPVHKLFLQLSLKGMGVNINGGISMTGERILFKKSVLVAVPSTRVSFRACKARSIASFRLLPWAISLASIGSKEDETRIPSSKPSSTRIPSPAGSRYRSS